MKVLKDNYQKENIEKKVKEIKPYPRILVCEQCSSELEYVESDLRIGAYGCVYVDCPCCNYDNMIVNHENEINLTIDNIEFPIHFHHTSKETGAVNTCTNENVKSEIRRGITFLRQHKKEFSWMTEYGNLHIDITRYDGDENYEVFVCNDYYNTYIPYEDIDYEDK